MRAFLVSLCLISLLKRVSGLLAVIEMYFLCTQNLIVFVTLTRN